MKKICKLPSVLLQFDESERFEYNCDDWQRDKNKSPQENA